MSKYHKVDRDYLLSSFLKYVKVDTASTEGASIVPSTKGQLELGKILVADIKKLGIKDVKQDKNGYVIARIKGNTKAPTIGFIAHLDTSPAASGKNVKPMVHANYKPSDIKLPKGGVVIKLSDFPELKEKKGKTIITADGSTLLGGDDKCGMAICMEVAKFLVKEKNFKHGDVLFIFTPDEEVAHGSDLLPVKELKAAAAYTIDGNGHATISEDTFCAYMMTVHFKGLSIHPGEAKGRMINALRIAAKFIEKLPSKERPETTENRQGFFHPTSIQGDVTDVKVVGIVRDFTVQGLKDRTSRISKLAKSVCSGFKGASCTVDIKEQYMNMKYRLDDDPRVVGYLKDAFKMSGLKPVIRPVRGGTDGARLSYRGLLTPDIAAGYYGMHGLAEWACLEEMEETAVIARNLISRWAQG